MQWLRENWFWVIVAVLFAWMHAGMHRGHGHGGHQPRAPDREPRPREPSTTEGAPERERDGGPHAGH